MDTVESDDDMSAFSITSSMMDSAGSIEDGDEVRMPEPTSGSPKNKKSSPGKAGKTGRKAPPPPPIKSLVKQKSIRADNMMIKPNSIDVVDLRKTVLSGGFMFNPAETPQLTPQQRNRFWRVPSWRFIVVLSANFVDNPTEPNIIQNKYIPKIQAVATTYNIQVILLDMRVKTSVEITLSMDHENWHQIEFSKVEPTAEVHMQQKLNHIIKEKQLWDEHGCNIDVEGNVLTEILHHSQLAYTFCTTFYHREKVLQKALQMIAKPNRTPPGVGFSCVSLVVMGKTGSGKSAFLAKLADALFTQQLQKQTQQNNSSNDTPHVPIIMRHCSTSQQSRDIFDLLRSICEQIECVTEMETTAANVITSLSAIIQYFKSLIRAYAIILILDSIDTVTNNHDSTQTAMSFLRNMKINENSRIILSCCPDEQNLDTQEWVNYSGISTILLSEQTPVICLSSFTVNDETLLPQAQLYPDPEPQALVTQNNENNTRKSQFFSEQRPSLIAGLMSFMSGSSNKVNPSTDNAGGRVSPRGSMINTVTAAENPGVNASTKVQQVAPLTEETDHEKAEGGDDEHENDEYTFTVKSHITDPAADLLTIFKSKLKNGATGSTSSLTSEQMEFCTQFITKTKDVTVLTVGYLTKLATTWTESTQLPVLADTSSIISALFDALDSKHGMLVTRAIICFLSISVFGVTDSEMIELLSAHTDVMQSLNGGVQQQFTRFPLQLWLNIRCDLNSLMLVERDFGRTTWLHKSVHKLALSRCTAVELKTARMIMARYYMTARPLHVLSMESATYYKTVFTNSSYEINYRCIEAVPHMLESQMYVEIIDTICHFEAIYQHIITGFRTQLAHALRTVDRKLTRELKDNHSLVMFNHPRTKIQAIQIRANHYYRWLQQDLSQLQTNFSASFLSLATAQPSKSVVKFDALQLYNQSKALTAVEYNLIISNECSMLETLEGQQRLFSKLAKSYQHREEKQTLSENSFSLDAWIRTITLSDITEFKDLQCTYHYNASCVSFNPNGKQFATGSIDKNIRLWDVLTGIETHTFIGHTNDVTCIAWHNTKTELVSVSFDGTVRLWDTISGNALMCLTEHNGKLRQVVWSPDYTMFASIVSDVKIRESRNPRFNIIDKTMPMQCLIVWNAFTGDIVTKVEQREYLANSILWEEGCESLMLPVPSAGSLRRLSIHPSPLPQHSGSAENSACTQGLVSENSNPDLENSTSPTKRTSFLGRKSFLSGVIGGNNETGSSIRKSQIAPDTSRSNANTETANDNSAETAGAAAAAAIGGSNGGGGAGGRKGSQMSSTSNAMPENTSEHPPRTHRPTRRSIYGLQPPNYIGDDIASPGIIHGIPNFLTNELLIARQEEEIYGLKLADHDGKRLHYSAARGHEGAILCVALSPDGSKVATASRDKTIRIWSSHDVETRTILDGHNGDVLYLAWSPDGRQLLSVSEDKTMKLWNIAEQITTQSIDQVSFHKLVNSFGVAIKKDATHLTAVEYLYWSLDGLTLTSFDSELSITWDTSNASVVNVQSSYVHDKLTVLSVNGRKVSCKHQKIRIYPTTEELDSLKQQPDDDDDDDEDDDENTDIGGDAADSTGTVSMKRKKRKKKDHCIYMSKAEFNYHAICWSTDERRIATASSEAGDGLFCIRLWNVTKRKCSKMETFVGSKCYALAFNHDTTKLAFAVERLITILECIDLETITIVDTSHVGLISTLVWNHDSTCMATADTGRDLERPNYNLGGEIKIWDTVERSLVNTLRSHTKGINCVVWSPDGTKLASCSDDLSVKIWDYVP